MKGIYPEALGNYAPECGSRSDLPWYCVQTHPHQEVEALRHIHRQGMKTYTPYTLKPRKPASHLGRPRKQTGPEYNLLFPGYIFVTFDEQRDRWHWLFSTHGVKQVFIWLDTRPQRVPPQAIQLAEMNSVDAPDDPIVPGDQVIILDGVMAGYTAIAQKTSQERILVLMGLLGQSVPIPLPRASVAKLA